MDLQRTLRVRAGNLRVTLTVTFAVGTDLDNAQVQVQNRVAQALPRLPAEVQRMLKQAAPGDTAEEIIRKALRSVLKG